MKKLILLILVVTAVAAQAQEQKPKLKDLLYSGKLRNDSNTVIRKTDDLSTKIDTGDRKKTEVKLDTLAVLPATVQVTDTVRVQTAPVQVQTVTEVAVDSVAVKTEEAPPVPAAAPPKTPAKIWKEHTDSLVVSLKEEVLSNKKIKKETYYVTVDYEVETTGAVNVTAVTISPKNDLLESSVRQRLQDSPPQLPAVPKKVKRKYNFTIIKD